MSRVTVVLSFTSELLEEVEKVLEKATWDYDGSESLQIEGVEIIVMDFNDVRYGSLPFLPELKKRGIPYEAYWENGGDFNEGTETCRFTEAGECIITEATAVCPTVLLNDLKPYFDNSEELAEMVKGLYEKYTPLPWTNQVEQGKLYKIASALL